MQNFPGIPPARQTNDPAGGSAPSRPAPPAPPADDASTATATTTEPRETGHQPFIIRSNDPDEERAEMLSDEQFMHEFLKESYTLPVSILLVGLGVMLGMGAVPFAVAGAMSEAIGAAVGVLVAALIGSLVAAGVGWLVGAMFGDDYGSAGALILRFSALTTATQGVLMLTSVTIGPMMSVVLSLPVMIAVVIFVAGYDVMRAVVYCALLSAAWFTLGFLALGALGVSLMGAGF